MSFSGIKTQLNFINNFSSSKGNEVKLSPSPGSEDLLINANKELILNNFSKNSFLSFVNKNNLNLKNLTDNKNNQSSGVQEIKHPISKYNFSGETGNKMPLMGSLLPYSNHTNINQNGIFEINLRDLTSSSINQNLISFSTTFDLPSNQFIAQTPSLQFYTPINNTLWGSNFQNHIRWFIGNNINRAEIFLTPPELGNLFIRVDQKNDSATLTISAQNNLLKDQLELSISQLKDLFKKDGLNLVHVNINNEDNRSLFTYQNSELKLEKNDSNRFDDAESTNNISLILDYRIIDEYV